MSHPEDGEVPTTRVVAATDGSSLGNPGPGGWAWVTEAGQSDSAGARHSTNNRMELRAVIELLRAIPHGQPLRIIADSEYVINVSTKWLPQWKQRGMRNSRNRPIENRDMIEALDELLQGRDIEWEWVRGHEGHPLNEKADVLATSAAKRAAARLLREAN